MPAEINSLPFAPDAMAVIHNSIQESTELKHPFLGRYHLFIGLIQENHNTPTAPFSYNKYPGLVHRLRDEAKHLYQGPGLTPPDGIMQMVKVIFQDAELLALRERSPFITADHLLLATLDKDAQDEVNAEAGALQWAGVSAQEVKNTL